MSDIFNELEKKAIVERYKSAGRKKSKQISPSIEVRNKYEYYFKNKQHCDDRYLKSQREELTEKRIRGKYENTHDSRKGTEENDNVSKHSSEKIMHHTSGHYKSSVKSPKKMYRSAEERSRSLQRKMSPSLKRISVTPEKPALQNYVSFFIPRSPHKSLPAQPVKSSKHPHAQAILPGSKQVSPGHLRQHRQFDPQKKHDYRSQYTDKTSRICRNDLSEEGQIGEPYGHRHFSRGDVIPDRRPSIKDRTRSVQSISTQPFVPKVSQEERQAVIDDDADQSSPNTSKTSICTVFFDEDDNASSKSKEVRQIEDNKKDKEQDENGAFDAMHQQHIAQTSEIGESEKHAARRTGKQPTQLKGIKARKHVYPHKIVHLTDTGKRLSQHFKEGKTDLDSKRVFQLDHLTPSGTDPFVDMPPEGSSLQTFPKCNTWSDDPLQTLSTKGRCMVNEDLKDKESSPLRVVETFINREALENYRNKYGNTLSKENSAAVNAFDREDFMKETKKCQVGQLIKSRRSASDIQPHI
ncbi:uncharacterized protein LOC118191510 [Stegodyphus dumicola]|uniref:uncharacterized protein LOC118191510 n=1 Tax=Stegodyphus dumicola TaxID=202533 RepID=UPI0015B1BBFD|nr:uncharacterized protein LOC118191510 [Stegodyphus dumicola]